MATVNVADNEMWGDLGRNWGWIVVRGVAAVAFGVLALLLPGITLAALVLFMGRVRPGRRHPRTDCRIPDT